MSLEVNYKGQQIAKLTEDGSVTLNTAGTYCEDDIGLTYSGGGGGGGTTEIPQKWKRPSDWPNLDLIDVSAPRDVYTVYVTIFCDGTWQYLATNSNLFASAQEITLDDAGNEVVVKTLTRVGYYWDIGQLTNGIHLIKITGSKQGLYLLDGNTERQMQQKTLEYLFIGCGESGGKCILNTGGTKDWICGTSLTLQHAALHWLSFNEAGSKILGAFTLCASLRRIDLHHCKNHGLSMEYAFRYTPQLLEVILDDVEDKVYTPTFYVYTLLETFDTDGLDFSVITTSTTVNEFNKYCQNLVNFGGLFGAPCNQTYANCTKLSHQSLLNIINALPTVTDTKTLTLGAVNKAKLTAEEIAVAEAKGWTVT